MFTPTAEGTYPFTVTARGSGCSAGTSTQTVTIVVEDVRCGTGLNKIQVCHNGQTICVASSALNAHLGRGRPGYGGPGPGRVPQPHRRPGHDGSVSNELGQVVARLFDGAVTSGQDYTLALDSQLLATGL